MAKGVRVRDKKYRLGPSLWWDLESLVLSDQLVWTWHIPAGDTA
jgi:hypothetical protein